MTDATHTADLVARAKVALEGTTPGPWYWGGYPDNLRLQTTHSGQRFVMSFERKGMRGAQPCFQPGKHGMIPAKDLLKFEVGDRSVVGETAARADGSVYRYDVVGIDAPDARLIASAPTLIADMADAITAQAAEIARLTERAEKAEAERDAALARGAVLEGAMASLLDQLKLEDEDGERVIWVGAQHQHTLVKWTTALKKAHAALKGDAA